MSDKITKLSQAIQLGATFQPQCIGAWFKDGKSCAIGSALEALTGLHDMEQMNEWLDSGHEVQEYLMQRFGMSQIKLIEVMSLNDGGPGRPSMTRERIAEWLRADGF